MGRICRPKLVRRARTTKSCPSPSGLVPLEPRRLFSAALTNGSFEDGLNGFTVLGGSAYVVDAAGGATDGTNALRFNGSSDISDAVIAQTLSTQAGQRYDVTFDYGTYGDRENRGQELRFEAFGGGDLITTQDYSVVRSAGFVTYTFSFVATQDATELRISDITTSDNARGLDGVLDNLRVSEASFLEPQIDNPGFEARDVGWVFAPGSQFEFRADRAQTEGDLAIAFNQSNQVGSAVLTQTLNTEVGTTYRVNFDYGLFGDNLARLQELRVEALNADEVLASEEYVATGSNDLTTRTFTFTATATTTDLRISDLTTLANSSRTDGVLDNLTIAAVNRAPVDLSFDATQEADNIDGRVDEGVAAGTLLGQFATTDFDVGDTQTYTLISGDTDLLQVIGDELFTRDTFDFDTRPTLTFVVRSTDRQGATLDRTFTVGVNDVVDPFPVAGLTPDALDRDPLDPSGRVVTRGGVLSAASVTNLSSGTLSSGPARVTAAVTPADFPTFGVSATESLQTVVRRLAATATTTGLLPVEIDPTAFAAEPSPEDDALPASPTATASSGSSAGPEPSVAVQPRAITLNPFASRPIDVNPWLAGTYTVDPATPHAVRPGGPTGDPVTAWIAWLERHRPVDHGGPSPVLIDPAEQMTAVPTRP